MIDIRGYIPSSMIDWPGRCVSMIFLPGCNFNCVYCHSGELVHEWKKLPRWDLDDIIGRINSNSNLIDGVVISGGEPTIHKDLPELCEKIKVETDKPIKLNTNGANFQMLRWLTMNKLVDFVSMDVKTGLNREMYQELARYDDPKLVDEVKASILLLKKSFSEHEFRITAFPPAIISDLRTSCLIPWLYGANRVVVQQFNPDLAYDKTARRFMPLKIDTLVGFAKDITVYANLKNDCEVRA